MGKSVFEKEEIVMIMQASLSSPKKSGKVYKFGVRVPRTTKDALLLDQQNKNSLWIF